MSPSISKFLTISICIVYITSAAACKKKYTCFCYLSDDKNSTTGFNQTATEIHTTKKDAPTECKNKSQTLATSSGFVYSICHL